VVSYMSGGFLYVGWLMSSGFLCVGSEFFVGGFDYHYIPYIVL